jgi:hypothetical protein
MVMGDENTGAVIEAGRDVEVIKMGYRIHSTSPEAAAETARSGTRMCVKMPKWTISSDDIVHCGAYGFNLGGWQGGRADYMLLPTTSTTPAPDQLERILGVREVDPGVDRVGLEAHGYGKEDREEHAEGIINVLFNVVGAGGALGIHCMPCLREVANPRLFRLKMLRQPKRFLTTAR